MMNVVTMIVSRALRGTRKGILIVIVILIWIGRNVQRGNFGLCDQERLACDRGSDDHINHENGFENHGDPVFGDSSHNLERVCLKNDWSTSQRADDSWDCKSYDENMRSMSCCNHPVCRSDRGFLRNRVFLFFHCWCLKGCSYEQQHVSCWQHLSLD